MYDITNKAYEQNDDYGALPCFGVSKLYHGSG